MVFKVFIHYLIDKYLKNYFERFDYEKVKLSLKSGNIVLENLRLKPEALAYLNIPLTVAVGYLEQLKVMIPWSNLSTSSTEVHINGVYLLIVSKHEMSQDLSEPHAEKAKRVQQKLNNFRKAALDSGKLDHKELDFIEKMRFQVMKNLVLTIRNLHICYETKSPTKLGHPFSFGITIHHVEISAADSDKSTKRTKGNNLLTYKIKEINSLSIYWNIKSKSRLDMSFNDVLEDLKSQIITNHSTTNNNEMRYIVRPINLRTESLITLKPKEHQYERSTLTFNINIPSIKLDVDSEQISDVLDFIKVQNYTTIYDRCREYRQLVLQESLGTVKLTPEQKQRVQFLESKLDIFHLAYIRYQVEIEVNSLSSMKTRTDTDEQQQGNTNSSDTQQSRWNSFSKLKNSLSNLTKNHRKTTTTTTNVQSERERFFEDSPSIDISINLNQIDLNLFPPPSNLNDQKTDDQLIACISVVDGRIDLKKMSVTSRIECSIELQFLRVFGIQCDEQYRPIIVMPMFLSSSPVVYIEFELFSGNDKSDYRLKLIVEPIRIIYDVPTVNQLIECFQANGDVIWKPTTSGEQNIADEKIFDMIINFKGVSIVLSEYGVFQEDFAKIRIDLGNLMLKSCLEDIDKNANGILFQEKVEERQFYRKYQLELSDLRMLYSHSNKQGLHILQRTPLIDIHFYKCIYPNDISRINWRMDVNIAMGEIQLSKIALTKLMLHFQSLPLLYSNLSIIVQRVNFYFTLFPPNTTLITNLSIYNCCLRLLMSPQISIRTDFHIYLTRNGDASCMDTQVTMMLNEPRMIEHVHSERRELSRLFYENNQIKLIYVNSETKLV